MTSPTENPTKYCTKCENDLPQSEFYPNPKAPGRFLSWCKKCRKKDVVRQRQDPAFRARVAAQQKARREADPEAARRRARVLYLRNQEKNRARSSAYYWANRDRILAGRRQTAAAKRAERDNP
ncbi:hypothetical protein ACFVGM_08775 [Kitasatospora purpeofusca]|uniref:hypothetical protein n=1 Tax=Kitasatospora purpeofusca TaxID=67352 RepID=UPI0036839E2C